MAMLEYRPTQDIEIELDLADDSEERLARLNIEGSMVFATDTDGADIDTTELAEGTVTLVYNAHELRVIARDLLLAANDLDKQKNRA